MELQRPLGVEILSAVAFVYFCGTMRLAISLACKGEIAERITHEVCNMPRRISLACKGVNKDSFREVVG